MCQEWIRELSDRQGQPCFVAVEWDCGIREKLDAEREDFLTRWARFRPNDPPGLVRQLSDVIGWEADAHVDACAGAEVCYLDDGRDPLPSSRPLGRNRRVDFEYILAPDPQMRPADEVLARIHQYYVEDAVRVVANFRDAGRDASRDHEWANCLSAKAAAQDRDTWGLVIVGAYHASRCDGRTLFTLLRERGHDCEAKFLGWEPTCGGCQ